jgi:hypothetical protein
MMGITAMMPGENPIYWAKTNFSGDSAVASMRANWLIRLLLTLSINLFRKYERTLSLLSNDWLLGASASRLMPHSFYKMRPKGAMECGSLLPL